MKNFWKSSRSTLPQHLIMKNYRRLASTRQHNRRIHKMFFLTIKQANLLCPKLQKLN